MHRTIDITVADNASDRLVADLSKVDGLIGLTSAAARPSFLRGMC